MSIATLPASRLAAPARVFRRAAVSGLLLVTAATTAAGQLSREAPRALSDAEFWEFFTTHSEPGGSFLSENFVSNEMTFQHVIPTLQKTLAADGVYLGVGPEQNFTYIANLKPKMAIIFDIRRQNAMMHLMYKAIFEQSPTRAEFVSRLFSRPAVRHVRGNVHELFAVADTATPSDSAFRANRDAIVETLTKKHGFAMSAADLQTVERLFSIFYEAGTAINYSFRPGSFVAARPAYATYGMLQTATNADSTLMAFLGTEENYRAIRDLQQRNLIVPVVGDFAGPKAIRSVGTYLRQRKLNVTAFYLSNVEQYLFQNGVAERFYDNVASLPIDSTGMFIRSVPGSSMSGTATYTVGTRGGSIGVVSPLGGSIRALSPGVTSGAYSVSVSSINGNRMIRIVQDSAGRLISRLYADSAGQLVRRPDTTMSSIDSLTLGRQFRVDSLVRSLPSIIVDTTFRSSSAASASPFAVAASPFTAVRLGGGLTSGIASIRKTLDDVMSQRIVTYRDIVATTKVSDWR